MQNTNNFKKTFCFKLCVFIFCSKSLWAFMPADYVSQENNVYMEIAPMEVGSEQLESFLVNITGPQLLESLKAQLAIKLGLNLFDKEELTNIGFDIQSPVGISGTWGEKNSFAIYLPATDSQRLYDFLKKVAQEYAREMDENLSPEESEFEEFEDSKKILVQEVVETKPGELFEIRQEAQITYFAKSKEFILISSDGSFLNNSLKPASEAISQEGYYKTLKQYFQKKNGGKLPLVSIYLSPTLLRKLEEQNRNLYGEKLSQALTDEMEKNILGIGGFFGFEQKRAVLSFIYFYQKGYLGSGKSLLAKILQGPKENLSLHFYPKLPIFMVSFRLHFPTLLDFILENEVSLRYKIDELNQKLKRDLNVDIHQDFLRAFQGNFTALITEIPPEKDIRNYLSWQWYASLGIFPEKTADLEKFLSSLVKFAQKKKKSAEFDIRTKKVGQKTLYQFTLLPSSKGESPSHIYGILTDNEFILSGRDNLTKEIPKGKINLIEQVSGNKSPHGFFYLNLSQFIDYAAKSSFRALLAPYLPYLRAFSSAYIISSVEGDFAFSDFIIRLR